MSTSLTSVAGAITMEKKFGLAASLAVTLLIDRNGRIASAHAGLVEREKFETDIRQLLDEHRR